MSVGAKFKGAAIGAYLRGGPKAVRAWHAFRHVALRSPRIITFYYQVDDPYSHLLAQALQRVVTAFPEVKLQPVVVPEPTADANPEPQKLQAYAMADAALLARHIGLRFPEEPVVPSEDRVRRVAAVLLEERSVEAWLHAAVQLGDALWNGRGERVAALVEELGTVAGQSVWPALEGNYDALRRAGHYMGGMLHYDGEWFWGLVRLPLLISRLVSQGLGEQLHFPRTSEFSAAALHDGRVPLTCFFSFRSPYSYVAIARLKELVEREPRVALTLKPVLPMVTRGLPVPKDKVMYIARDAYREALRLDIPFGNICDPLGDGVSACLAVYFAIQRRDGVGPALDFAAAAFKGIWANAIDVATVEGLAHVAAQAGIEIDLEAAMRDESWRDEAEANRITLGELGLWGVPSFQIEDWSTWGQDRIWAVEGRITASLQSG